MKRIVTIASAAMLSCALAPAGFAAEWQLDKSMSHIAFAGEQKGGVRFEGNFSAFSATVAFEPDSLTEAEVHLSIDTRTAATDSAQRDMILHQAAWLDSGEFPEAQFDLTGLDHSDTGDLVAHGTLTIRGHAQAIDVPVTVAMSDTEAIAKGALTIDRRDYGVGQGAWGETDEWVAYPIEIGFELVAHPPK